MISRAEALERMNEYLSSVAVGPAEPDGPFPTCDEFLRWVEQYRDGCRVDGNRHLTTNFENPTDPIRRRAAELGKDLAQVEWAVVKANFNPNAGSVEEQYKRLREYRRKLRVAKWRAKKWAEDISRTQAQANEIFAKFFLKYGITQVIRPPHRTVHGYWRCTVRADGFSRAFGIHLGRVTAQLGGYSLTQLKEDDKSLKSPREYWIRHREELKARGMDNFTRRRLDT